jgi:hypothetical protein
MTVSSGIDNHKALVKNIRQQLDEQQVQAAVYWLRSI